MYRKPAIPDDLLMSVDKPARYIGGEINSASKDFDDPRLKTKLVFCFPDVYEIGMSHLGIQILYDMFNQREDLYCDRVYSPWVDMDKVLRENQIPLFGVESQRPVRDFDFLLITLQYEMCYTNILQVLDLSGIPLEAEERGEEDPIVIGGGPCSYNPEPIAAFFDIFYIGEGETRYYMLMDLWQKMKAEGKTKREFLLEAGRQIPGLYIPALYEATYNEDGTIASFGPTEEGLPTVISRETVMDL
ncbi:MAG: B12-binding domain-containing radical SAM protein, partial [Lachnospiraceae bacterium]|nr:B12-binding domain-containing radical SAM protein [Lachnospiraceae bacterium]